MTGTHARVLDVASFLPERVVRNSSSEAGNGHQFFAGVEERRFASPEYSSAEMGTAALRAVLARNEIDASELDLLICSTLLNDVYTPGIGTAVQHEVGASNAAVLHVDNGCCSWISSIATARAFIESGRYRTVAVVTVTNFVSRLEEFQNRPESAVLGDGASATLLTTGDATIVGAYDKAFGENWATLRVEPEAVAAGAPPYWARGSGPFTVDFDKKMLTRLFEVAMEKVPEAVDRALADAGRSHDEVAYLITHQPNASFLDQWRKRCGIEAPRVHDTLRRYGNMFHSSLPVTFADALDRGMVSTGDLIVFATFLNGGEMVSALVWEWNGRTSTPAQRRGTEE